MIQTAEMRKTATAHGSSNRVKPRRGPSIGHCGDITSCKHSSPLLITIEAACGEPLLRRQSDRVRSSHQLCGDGSQVNVSPAREPTEDRLDPPTRGRRQLARDRRKFRQWPFGATKADQRRLMIISSLVGQISIVLVLLLAAINDIESFFIDQKQSPHTSEWSYGDQMRWREMHRDCSGRAQSPIDIKHKNVIISQDLRLNFYNYDQQIRFKLSNAHHTVKMNPIGPAYEQDYGQHAGGQRSAGLNASSIHDMMTVDEYVEITPTSNKRTSGGDAPVGGTDNDHMSRLQLSAVSNGQQQAAADAAKPSGPPKDGRGRHRVSQHQPADDIEHEREQNHGPMPAGFGSGLFGFQAAKERVVYDGAPTIKLDWLDEGNNEYKLRDIHFHWGERRDNGSEHAIDGRRAAMEMHLVHIKHGLDKSNIGFTSDSVAVVSILIESHRKSNLDFNPIVNELSRINSTERAQEVEYKNLFELLPNNLQAFYTYSGSLTTPPCYQVVNWIVMAERLNMNAKQIEMFRNLYAPSEHHKDELAAASDDTGTHHDHDGSGGNSEPATGLELIMPNVRSLQPLNNRTILASFTKHGSRLASVTSSINSAAIVPIHIAHYLPIALLALVFQLTNLWRPRQQQPSQ